MKFDKSHVKLDTKYKTKNELFVEISKIAIKNSIAKKEKTIISGFEKRESEGTTGFEDGFAIPHARVEGINEPSIFVVRNKEKFQDWDALDGKGVQYGIALLIPIDAGDLHIEVLSSIATQLMKKDFRESIKSGSVDEIFKLFKKLLSTINQDIKAPNKSIKNAKNIVGVSACPVGIAHTFMAKQKMEDSANEMGFNIKWETQGANGQKTPLSESEIKDAEVVIIASDIDIDLSRFIGKKMILTTTNDAIKNGKKLLDRAINKAQVFDGKSSGEKNLIFKFFRQFKKAFQSNFGVPWLYLSITGTLLAIISLIAYSSYGQRWTTDGFLLNKNLFKLQEIAKFSLYLSMPFMASKIAKSMTGRIEAFVIAFIGSFLLNVPLINSGWNVLTNASNNPTKFVNVLYDWNGLFNNSILGHGSNIIGAIVLTFTTIIVTNTLFKIEKFISKQNHLIYRIVKNGLSPWFTITLSAIISIVFIVFFLGAPMSWVSHYITFAIVDYSRDYWWLRLIIGGIFGILISSDLGGIINKISIIALIGIAQYDLKFAAIISAGIPVASLGYGLTYSVHSSKFKKEDAEDASLSFRKGLNGMTEGPLFLTNKYGLRVIIPNLLSSFVSCGLTLVLGLYFFKGGHIGVLFLGAQADLSYVNDISWLNSLLPRGEGVVTALCSIVYGIIGYYLVLLLGSVTYLGVSSLTFSLPGKNKIFIPKKVRK